jgi:hypothetical protein
MYFEEKETTNKNNKESYMKMNNKILVRSATPEQQYYNTLDSPHQISILILDQISDLHRTFLQLKIPDAEVVFRGCTTRFTAFNRNTSKCLSHVSAFNSSFIIL